LKIAKAWGNPDGDIGCAFLDESGRNLGFQGGFGEVTQARETASNLARVQTYPDATKIVIFRGRTLAEGTVLEEHVIGQ
jgi:hypothetical protein